MLYYHISGLKLCQNANDNKTVSHNNFWDNIPSNKICQPDRPRWTSVSTNIMNIQQMVLAPEEDLKKTCELHKWKIFLLLVYFFVWSATNYFVVLHIQGPSPHGLHGTSDMKITLQLSVALLTKNIFKLKLFAITCRESSHQVKILSYFVLGLHQHLCSTGLLL